MAVTLTVLLPNDGETWQSFLKRAAETPGEIVLVLAGMDSDLAGDPDALKDFIKESVAIAPKTRIATRVKSVAVAARSSGMCVVDRVKDLETLLAGHPMLPEAMRAFSPRHWQQQLRSKLQSMGLLALPRWRIWALIVVSAGLFFAVLFWLLPSAEIRIWPREDTVSQTANIFLVQSGATTVAIPPRVRTMELLPIRVEVTRNFTFDQISKDFVGESARGTMTIVNKSKEQYSLRPQTRIANNAGMIFLLLDGVDLAPGEEAETRVEAAPLDLYGEIIGERGNLPAGLKWEFLGLSPEERTVVYAENRSALSGGKTSFRTLLHEQDLTLATKTLEQELLATAKQLVDEEKLLRNTQDETSHTEILYYDELTQIQFHDFQLPREFLGQQVTSIPVQGSLTYTAFAYDSQAILDLLRKELQSHVTEGKILLEESIALDRLVAHVIDYGDDLSWIKLTVDLSGTEQFVLDPLTPNGARFGKSVRELVTGLPAEDARRILRNLPEVDNAVISLWPPWSSTLPRIPSHITITPFERSSTSY